MSAFRWMFLFLIFVAPVQAQLDPSQLITETTKPMIMPAAGMPGPDTWMFGQPYGNTVGAYNFGDQWYRAGQGLHFGIDLSMPCGTPLVAVADGTVAFVDDRGFGSMPHNLILRHDALELTTLYGHLLETPTLTEGQFVRQGDIIGFSGDPDLTCDSRPHLHFEVRSMDYSRTVNPSALIEAEWDSLALIGPYSFPLFQQNLNNPRQWVTVEDQPDVYFWGQILNNYEAAWPPKYERRAAPNPPLARILDPVSAEMTYSARKIAADTCCTVPWWHPADANRIFAVDGPPGSRAGVFAWDANTGQMLESVATAPPPVMSEDGAHDIELLVGGQTLVRRLSDGAEFIIDTMGQMPTLNANSTQLMWTFREGVSVPGQERPETQVYISDLNGENTRELLSEPGADARWLNENRVLVSVRENRVTSLSVWNALDGSSFLLGSWREMRGLSVSPGGGRVMFYLSWQQDPASNGVYVVDTQPGGVATRMPWFGAWRWRDDNSLYYVPFEPSAAYHTLAAYDLTTGTTHTLLDPGQQPFTIMNGHWDVSADGQRIVFQNAIDRSIWVLEPAP